jgi:phage/plasmid primase-like uncharacterized protein
MAFIAMTTASVTIPADWIDRARNIRTAQVLHERGILRGLRGSGLKLTGPCPRCGCGQDRFAVHLGKGNGGSFNCRICRLGGNDAIALVQFLDQCDFRRAIETLNGEAAPEPIKPDNKNNVVRLDQLLREQHEAEELEAEEQQRQHDKARWLWSQRRPIGDTPAEVYLRKARGITCQLPPTLAYLAPYKSKHHPAMIAAFGLCPEDELGQLRQLDICESVHLTLLKPDGSGKAEAEPNKIAIGAHKGLPIVLAPPNDLLGLAITEGIEDALSVHEATGLGVWAAGGAQFMPALAEAVPSYIEAVTIYADADATGRRAACELVAALHRHHPCDVSIVGG